MANSTPTLPQLHDRLFLTDGGLETFMIFDEGVDLPHFAAFELLRDAPGRARLMQYYERYIALARDYGMGFVLESPTWRASPDWGELLGHSGDELADINRAAIRTMQALRDRHQTPALPILISGCIGPRGDGYIADTAMTPAAAEAYHVAQIATFVETGVDMVSAITMTNAAEATGIARAAQRMGVPPVISFTVETDGRLPSGQALGAAIAEVDAATGAAPAYYMINCAHPTHYEAILTGNPDWTLRLGGMRANSSILSHAELNDAVDLDRGDPVDLGRRYGALRAQLPQLRVLGGCCGTDHQHVAQIAAACA
jgi:S-methylmethionine-dependent homocysteine/selenocysteine methylase